MKLWLAWNEPNPTSGSSISTARRLALDRPERDRLREDLHRRLRRRHADADQGRARRLRRDALRGNNQPTSARPTVSPLAFMRALKAAGLSARFHTYAHHPYYGRRTEMPSTRPSPTAVTMKIVVLIAEWMRL